MAHGGQLDHQDVAALMPQREIPAHGYLSLLLGSRWTVHVHHPALPGRLWLQLAWWSVAVMRPSHAVMPHVSPSPCRQVQEQFPGAEIVASTLDGFVEPLLKAAPSLDLPVVS